MERQPAQRGAGLGRGDAVPCWELHLFLDTHPNNCDAARRLEEYRQRLARMVKEYEEKFGPMGELSSQTSRWAWINGPWPWERTGDD